MRLVFKAQVRETQTADAIAVLQEALDESRSDAAAARDALDTLSLREEARAINRAVLGDACDEATILARLSIEDHRTVDGRINVDSYGRALIGCTGGTREVAS